MNPFSPRALPLFPLLLTLLVQGVDAQRQYDQDKMRASFAAMQGHDWYTGGGWTTSFDAAKLEAEKTGKPIFAYFTRTWAP